MTADKYLQQIEKYDRMIESRKFEIIELQNNSALITNYSTDIKVQTSRRTDRTERIIVSNLDRINILQDEICDCWEKRNTIIKVLEELDAKEYGLLYYLYVERISIQEAADRFDRSYRWAVHTKGTALEHLQKILDERETFDKSSMVTGYG